MAILTATRTRQLMARRQPGAGQLEKRMNTNVRSSARRSRWQRLEEDRPARILLAEDDDEMRKLLEVELRADGYVVFAVSDGTEMLEALSDMSGLPFAVPDIIVMDVRMPGCSGVHILAALRAAQWLTPVILITAFGDARLHEEATRLGAAVIFNKPFDLDDLRTALLHLLGDEPRSPERELASDSDEAAPSESSKPR